MLRHLLAEREEELPPSRIGKLIEIAEKGGDIISLGAGELDYPAPARVRSAAIRAITAKRTHYSPPQGIEELREAIVQKVKRQNKISSTPEQVLVTNGSTEGIFLGLLSTVDPGEGVLIPDPGFLAYTPTVEVLNGMPLAVKLRASSQFTLTKEALEDAIIPEKTRVLILNTPCNPMGTVLTKKELEVVADVATEYNLLVLSDEAYEYFVYKGKHISFASLNGMHERTLTLQSFSKSFAMPGLRLGYAIGPEKLIAAMTKLHIYTSICASTISQHAGIQALKEKPTGMVKEYNKRRLYTMKRIRSLGWPCVEPTGAFYAFPSITGKSDAFAKKLLDKARVAVVPGTEFGKCGEGHIRISYASPIAKLAAAFDRIESCKVI